MIPMYVPRYPHNSGLNRSGTVLKRGIQLDSALAAYSAQKIHRQWKSSNREQIHATLTRDEAIKSRPDHQMLDGSDVKPVPVAEQQLVPFSLTASGTVSG